MNVPKVVTYTTTLSVSNTSPGAGEFIDLTATVTPDDGTSPIWGTVTFFDGDQYLGIGFPDSNGMATYTFSSEATGAHTLRGVLGPALLFRGSPRDGDGRQVDLDH